MSGYQIDDLLQLMRRLRDPDSGCPWDLEQTPRSVINYSIEEVYELADAIERDASPDICDELGDVLFQVVFLAQFASESGDFTFADVVDGVTRKLLRRHPHVFPDGQLNAGADGASVASLDAAGVARQWDEIKAGEKGRSTAGSAMDSVPAGFPPLLRAHKLQKQAAKLGLDWPDTDGAFDKLCEELEELQVARSGGSASRAALEEELGDLLFSCVNVARKLGIDAGQALGLANQKFASRVRAVEAAAGDDIRELSAASLDRLWEQTKAKE